MLTISRMDDRTRSTLLMRLKDRTDNDAWDTFASLYRPLIVSYALSRDLSHSDAEDVAQQCTQAVLEKIDGYQHLSSFKAWLRAIADHKIIDQYRRSRRQVQGDTAFWNAQEEASGSLGPQASLSWDREWTHAHMLYCAERVRSKVNESTYEAFAALVLRGLEPPVVAAALNLTVNQVYVAKHRVLEHIRTILKELHGQDGVV